MARPRDIRFVVTNLDHGSPEWLYDSVYCARGQAENLIKLHKTQLTSERTSAAYWLMLPCVLPYSMGFRLDPTT